MAVNLSSRMTINLKLRLYNTYFAGSFDMLKFQLYVNTSLWNVLHFPPKKNHNHVDSLNLNSPTLIKSITREAPYLHHARIKRQKSRAFLSLCLSLTSSPGVPTSCDARTRAKVPDCVGTSFDKPRVHATLDSRPCWKNRAKAIRRFWAARCGEGDFGRLLFSGRMNSFFFLHDDYDDDDDFWRLEKLRIIEKNWCIMV